MSESIVVKFEKTKNSLSAFLCFALFTHRFLSFYPIRKMFNLSRLFSLVLMAVLLVTSVKAFEVELCNNDLPKYKNINASSLEGINAKDGNERSPATDNKNSLENHNFCHQNHICQLIFYKENNFNIHFNGKGAQETFLFPPEDLFFEGPFRPPKSTCRITFRFFEEKLI